MKNKFKSSIAVLIICLIATIPLSSAQLEQPEDNFEEEETGASVLVRVDSYEPRIVPSNILEEDDAPIYAFLKADTAGSLLADAVSAARDSRNENNLRSITTSEPMYSAPDIQSVLIRPLDEDTANMIRGNPRYIRPDHYSLDNLGYLMILLRQVENEQELPEEVTLNMEAEIWFENAERLFSLIQQDIVVPLDADEQLWRSKPITPYSFFAGRGYVRASDIGSDSANLVIYSGSDRTWPYTGTPRPIQSLQLSAGETSEFIRLQETGNMDQNAFRVSLVDVIDNTQDRVKLSVDVDGKMQEIIVAEGMKILPGSEWTVSRIDISETDEGTKYEVTISSADDQRVISAVYPKGTIEQEQSDPCENSPVLLGNLAGQQNEETKTAGELNQSALLHLNSMQLMSENDFPSTAPAGRYVRLISTNNNQVTLAIDNVPERVSRVSGWTDPIKKLNEIFLQEMRSRYGAGITEQFTLTQGTSKRVNSGDITYTITAESLANGRALVRVTKKINSAPSSAEIRPIVSLSTSESSESLEAEIKQTSSDFVYCTAIQQYKKIITDYRGVKDENGVLLSDIASYHIGKIYDELGYPRLAINYYGKSIENGIGEFLIAAQGKITFLQQMADQGARVRKATITDNGREVHLRAGSIYGSPDAKPKAVFEIDGRERELSLGGKLFTADTRVAQTREHGAYTYNWRVKEIGDNSVVVEQYAISGNIPVSTADRILGSGRETVNLRETELIDDNAVELKSIDSQKFALIRIIPGTGRPLVSRSNFTLHIPIEKRAIKQTPSEIASKINSTEAIIKDLDKIITRLDKVVQMWKRVCLVTFAFLTIKNSFLSGLSRTQARRIVMRGQDGNSGWDLYCQQNSGPNKRYSNENDCINSNLDKISNSISESQDAIDRVNEEMENYQSQPWFNDLTNQYENFDTYGQFTEESFSPETLRDYRYWQLMKQSASYENLAGQREGESTNYNFRQEVNRQLSQFNFDNNRDRYNHAVETLDRQYPNFNSLSDEEQKQVFRDVMSSQPADVSSEEFVFLGDLDTSQLQSIRRDDEGIYANTQNGRIRLNEATVLDYQHRLDKERQINSGSSNELADEISRVARNYERNPRAPLISSQGQVYTDAEGRFYVADSVAFSTGQTREDYASSAAIEIYPDGRPYCVPSGDGNYVKILDFYEDVSPKTIQQWNVGTDGMLCTGDDVLLKHQSVLGRPENSEEQNRLLELASRVGRKQEGDVVSSGGRNFIVDARLSRSQQNVNAPKCYDVMDPSDCQTLFGVCDPVMCPPSRFNLGGSWQVDNVVQTGLIGSLVLGLHNFGAKEPVPICLTGVIAGLRNIKSILQGYTECLKTAQIEGKSVGICDTIRSVFTCELIWREATSLFKLRGSIFKWIGQNVFGQSEEGGEYLTLQNSFQNVEDSVNFFTKEYSAQAFAAYNSRSSDEIGSSICRAAIYGKAPEIGKMIEQLSTPESPPQYIATLSVKPYSETLQESIYSVYYHIYSGENQDTDYSVFLKSETGDTYYVTERCRGRTGHIEKGGMADSTIDCRAPKNFKEVCINVNGATKCGFGKVTTDFGLNYLNDYIVKGDVQRQIQSEEDCISGDAQGSPALLGLGIASAIGLPYASEGARAGVAARDLTNTGIVRVCSVQNPCKGTNPQDYKVVGTCGKDSDDRLLGSCWIDLRTVTLHDAENIAEVSEQLDEQTLEAQRNRLGITNTIDKEQSLSRYNEIESFDKTSCLKSIDALKQYDNLAERSVSYEISGKSRIRVAEMYEYLARACAKDDPLREYNRLVIELENRLQSIVNTFNNNLDRVRQENSGDLPAIQAAVQTESQAALSEMSQIETEYSARAESLKVSGETNVGSIVQAYKARVSSGEIVTAVTERRPVEVQAEELSCSRCGDGAFNRCNDEECHGINANCYFYERTNNLLGIDVNDAFNNECHSCAKATECSTFDSDKSKCESQSCTSQSGLRCSWLEIGSVGRCVPDTGIIRNPERETRNAECSSCGSFNPFDANPCDDTECHGNGADCYFSPRISGLGLGGSCKSCNAAQSCEDFDNDKSLCNNYDGCTIAIGKRCAYNDAEEKCTESIGEQPSAELQIPIGANVPRWVFVNTVNGEDYTDIKYNPEINYRIQEVIGNYLKTNKAHVSEAQRERYINAIQQKAVEYGVNPFVIAATIELESNWREVAAEIGGRTADRTIALRENSYGPMQCNANPKLRSLGLLQNGQCISDECIAKKLEIRRATISIEGGLDCGTRILSNVINSRNLQTFIEVRFRYVGYSNLDLLRANNHDIRKTLKNDPYVEQRVRSWPIGNALIKKLVTDAQRLSQQSPESNIQAGQPQPSQGGKKVAVMGDSITGWQGRQPANNFDCTAVTQGGTNYVVELANRCSNTFANLGIGGQNTGHMLSRFDSQVTGCNYNEVIILGGVNDMGNNVANIKSNLGNMYRKAKEKNMRVIAVTILPWKGYSTWTEEKQRKTEEVNAWIMNEAENVDVRIDAYSVLVDPNDPGKLKEEYTGTDVIGGYLHPGREGQKKIADTIIAAAYRNECN